jgi:hypothetical protein
MRKELNNELNKLFLNNKMTFKFDNSKPLFNTIFKYPSFIYGGFVYKHLVHNDEINDLDVAVKRSSMDALMNDLKNNCECVSLEEIEYYNVKTKKLQCPQGKVDIASMEDLLISYKNGYHFTPLAYTKYGLRMYYDLEKEENYNWTKSFHLIRLVNKHYWSEKWRAKDVNYLLGWKRTKY